jgi:hypothetical protein
MRQRRFCLLFQFCFFWFALVSAIAASVSFATADTFATGGASVGMTVIGSVFGPIGYFAPPDGAVCPRSGFCILQGGTQTTSVSGSWLANPTNSQFTTGTNWTSSPNAPNWRGGVATFGSSNTTALTIDNAGSYVDLDSFVFTPGAPAYSFTVASRTTLHLDSGIVDNSGNLPSFTLPTGAVMNL